eukprot:scaffold10078_cov56-Isochrysis_galbana.AAC.1
MPSLPFQFRRAEAAPRMRTISALIPAHPHPKPRPASFSPSPQTQASFVLILARQAAAAHRLWSTSGALARTRTSTPQ